MRLVLVALLTFVNEAKGYAWPGVDKIAERSGHCVRTVQEALGKAEGTGWLRRDAVPGRVTLYYPSLPDDPTMHVTPASAAGVGVQALPRPPQSAPLTPADSAGEPRKEPGRESKKEGGPPACPVCCVSPMERKTPRRKDVPWFWGCSRYKAAACPGKREQDGSDSSPRRKPTVSDAPDLTKPTMEARRSIQEAKAQRALEDERGEPSELDAFDVARLRKRTAALADQKRVS